MFSGFHGRLSRVLALCKRSEEGFFEAGTTVGVAGSFKSSLFGNYGGFMKGFIGLSEGSERLSKHGKGG